MKKDIPLDEFYHFMSDSITIAETEAKMRAWASNFVLDSWPTQTLMLLFVRGEQKLGQQSIKLQPQVQADHSTESS